jgi:hypothetical protein
MQKSRRRSADDHVMNLVVRRLSVIVNGPNHFCTQGPNALHQKATKAKRAANTHGHLTLPKRGQFKGLTTRQCP